MRIMFMGTPEIAMKSLAALIKDGHNVVAAVTREDKPRGRGNVMTPTPVKNLALENEIPTYTPATLRDEAFMEILRQYDPELIVVVAYGKILPKAVLEYPKFGCINLHVSVLPEYRGAAPIQRAIMEGESRTGVTVMYMDEGLDTGDIIAYEFIDIGFLDNAETIHDKAADVGSKLLSRTIYDIADGTAKREPQDHSLATYAAKIEKEDCKINFDIASHVCQCRIRGVTPFPGAFCFHRGRMLKIVECMAYPVYKEAAPGTVIEVNGIGDGHIIVACKHGALHITKVKPEGKGVMSAGDFVRGRKIEVGEILT